MVFSVLILVALLGIAYYHYLQGAFTALISAFCALLATLVAFGYYEVVFAMVPAGKMVSYAPALVLVALYAITYIVLRIIFDSVAPGNLRLPAVADKSAAGVLGLIAGLFGSGVLAVAGQYMPFGPTIGGFARYPVEDHTVIIPRAAVGTGNDVDSHIDNQLKDNAFAPDAANGLLVPADGFVTSVVTMASDGPMSGENEFSAIHPQLLTELFGNRVGAEVGASRVANGKSAPPATLQGVFTLPSMPSADTEITKLRPSEKPLTYQPSAGDVLIALRLKLTPAAADGDNNARFTPAALPLKLGGRVYYPIGTLAGEAKIGLARLDDLIVVPVKGKSDGVDLVYSVDKATFDNVVANGTIKDGAGYVQVKLLARLPLEGKVSTWTPAPNTDVLRKTTSPYEIAGEKSSDNAK